jgi:hypothetical protein
VEFTFINQRIHSDPGLPLQISNEFKPFSRTLLPKPSFSRVHNDPMLFLWTCHFVSLLVILWRDRVNKRNVHSRHSHPDSALNTCSDPTSEHASESDSDPRLPARSFPSERLGHCPQPLFPARSLP